MSSSGILRRGQLVDRSNLSHYSDPDSDFEDSDNDDDTLASSLNLCSISEGSDASSQSSEGDAEKHMDNNRTVPGNNILPDGGEQPQPMQVDEKSKFHRCSLIRT